MSIFLLLVWLTIFLVVLGMIYTYRRTRDVFHPVMVAFPMFGFIYGWMPLHLSSDALGGYFYPEQLWFAQIINILGVLAFLLGSASVRLESAETIPMQDLILDERLERRLLLGALVTGALGLVAWAISIRNVGGVVEAFSHPYSGGWDDSGYIRDGSLTMFSAVILAIPVLARGRRKWAALAIVAAFVLPWAIQALFTSRRGPTFMVCTVLAVTWFLSKRTRPPLAAVLACGFVLGYGILLLVVNRNQIYMGSDFALNRNVDSYVKTNDASNEYVYGAGSILNAWYLNHYFWGRRYLAQVVVRPIPSSLWPTKYEDVGVAEVLKNAGNGTSFASTLGWIVPPGAAPGIVADLWVEFSWLALLALWLAGRFSTYIWRQAVTAGAKWTSQYCVCVALSIYFVMQTMEAVIFRFLLLSIPIWVTWSWARYFGRHAQPPLLIQRSLLNTATRA